MGVESSLRESLTNGINNFDPSTGDYRLSYPNHHTFVVERTTLRQLNEKFHSPPIAAQLISNYKPQAVEGRRMSHTIQPCNSNKPTPSATVLEARRSIGQQQQVEDPLSNNRSITGPVAACEHLSAVI